MLEPITLTVNGQSHQLICEPETPLLYILRNDLGLSGAKFACGLEQCGACLVLLNGQARPSCKISVAEVQELEIITLEGLGTAENLHPLQQAFIDEQAIQCGFCVGGMIVAAKALLDKNPHPSESEIRVAMAHHLCRCGVHNRVVRAIQRAATIMQAKAVTA